MSDTPELQISDKGQSRRQFVIYASGIAAAAVAGTGFYVARRYDVFNHPPVADFGYSIITIPLSEVKANFDCITPERTLKYIAPTSEEEIVFLNKSGENLSGYSWSIDDRIVAETKEYSTKLSMGEHKTKFTVKGKPGENVVNLVNKSEDPDAKLPSLLRELFGVSSELGYVWIVDGQKVSSDKDYSLKLPTGEHKVGLSVSDGKKESYVEKYITVPEVPKGLEDSVEKSISVDPADLPEYPRKELRIPIKGICMNIGCSYDVPRRAYSPEFPPVGDEEISESLSVIRKELGCNAVRFFGNENDRMISAVKIAKDLNFETIMASPQYINANIDMTIQLMSPLAEALETLRDDSVVLNVGNELITVAYGIIEGETYDERGRELNKRWDEITTSQKYQGRLNQALESILKAVRPRFGGKVTYSKHLAETVRWNELGFDIVSANDYYNNKDFTEQGYISRINSYTQFGRPAYLTEFGFYTFDECLRYGGTGYWYVTEGWRLAGNKPPVYSQEAQAQAIDVNIQLLNRTKLDAIYLWALIEKKADELDITSDGIVKFSKKAPWNRKKASSAFAAWVTPS